MATATQGAVRQTYKDYCATPDDERYELLNGAREHTITDDNVRGAPDLVIEILSRSTADRDLGYKRDLYGRHGVLEYWSVDPMAETVTVHRQGDGSLEVAETLGSGDTLRTGLLNGLQLKLDDVFAS